MYSGELLEASSKDNRCALTSIMIAPGPCRPSAVSDGADERLP